MMAVSPRRPRLGYLASGPAHRALVNLLQEIAASRLPVELAVVVVSGPGARALETARSHGVPAHVVDHRLVREPGFSDQISTIVRSYSVDLVILCGFLHLWRFPPEFVNKVLNFHPGLLPRFGGRGMHGRRIHQAVHEAGCRETGCTVHIADHEYDHGPVVLEHRVALTDHESVDSIADKVFAAECVAYPNAIRQFLGLSPPDPVAAAVRRPG